MTYLSKRAAALAIALLSCCSPLFGATTFKTVHDFPTTGEDGLKPQTAMTLGPDGNLYGTTIQGGLHGGGTLFRYSFDQEEPGFSVIHDFEVTTTGAQPKARLLNIGDGYLYGATYTGGNVSGGAGTVYRLDPFTGNVTVVYAISSAGSTTPKKALYLTSGEPNVLHVVCEDKSGIWRVPLDGSIPEVASFREETPKPTHIMRGSDGFLYGATSTGGIGQEGTLFRTNADGSNWTIIHDCEANTGRIPTGPPVEDENGHFYGVMGYQGPSNVPSVNGVLYRLTPTPGGDYTYTVLRAFGDFDVPSGELLLAPDGLLYGVARFVGPGGNGNGGVYRVRRDGSGFKALHVFESGVGTSYPTGRNPIGGLVQGPDGCLYGTSEGGPNNSGGSIFRLDLNLSTPPVNRPPIALADHGFTTGAAVTVPVTANDFDPDRDNLFVSIETQPEHGTVQLNSNGSIQYTPDGTFTGSDSFTYKLSDQRGGFSTATVTISNLPAGPLFGPGTYVGLVSRDEDLNGPDNVARGQIQVTVQANNSFTGTVFTQNKRISLRGVFSEDGTAVTTVKLPNKVTAVVFLAFLAGNPSTLTSVFFGEEFWVGSAAPTSLPDITARQSYTVQIGPDSENLPVGFGYGTMTLNTNGSVKLIGKLGDGKNFKWSSMLVRYSAEDLGIPFYSMPVKQGYASGILFTANEDGLNFSGAMIWRRPTAPANKPYTLGFSGAAEIAATRFIAPAAADPVMQISGATVRLGGPMLESPVQGAFTIDGKKIQADGDLRSFTINRRTGLFSGTMKNGRKTISFKGAVRQSSGVGLGQFIIGGETGRVEFGLLEAN